MVKKLACRGQPPDFENEVDHYMAFVQAHAGGTHGQYLKALEQYERGLNVKRAIQPLDMQKLAGIKLPDAPRYVPAMVKCLLNAPPTKVNNGFAEVFTAGDIAALAPASKYYKLAEQAHDIMVSASNFLAAYCQLDPAEYAKMVDDLEVRCVMHVHQVKASTRKEYASLLHIAAALYQEVKEVDTNLPEWPKLRVCCLKLA